MGTRPDVRSKTYRSGPICDDPRQAVPPSGQTWTNLAELGDSTDKGQAHYNTLQEDEDDDRVILIGTQPSFAIGQTRTSACRLNLRSLDAVCCEVTGHQQ